jgi:DNA-binding PadR family transcriptional regulator
MRSATVTNTTVENIILGCLSFGPRSGYEIKKIINMSSSWFYNASYGSIYPILKKHEEKGLVSSEEVVDNGRYKRLYKMTDKGYKVFHAWMLQSPKLMTVKYEMAVKLMFFAKIAPEQRIKQIEEHIDQLILFKQELEEIEPFADSEGDAYQRLILDWGENLYVFLIQWFSTLLEELKKYDGDLPQKPKNKK